MAHPVKLSQRVRHFVTKISLFSGLGCQFGAFSKVSDFIRSHLSNPEVVYADQSMEGWHCGDQDAAFMPLQRKTFLANANTVRRADIEAA